MPTVKKVFSIILGAAFGIVNVLHLPWLLYVLYLVVQSLDFGTHLEMFVLLPWIFIEAPSIIPIAAEIAFLIFARGHLRRCRLNLCLFFIYVFQLIAFNLCIFFG